MEENKKPILVLGIGNFLFKDGGVGVHVARKMMGMKLPPDVRSLTEDSGKSALFPLQKGRKRSLLSRRQRQADLREPSIASLTGILKKKQRATFALSRSRNSSWT